MSFLEETLFFVLATKQNDGTRYTHDLYARGIHSFVVSEEGFRKVEALGSPLPDLSLLVAPGPLKVLRGLTGQHRDRFRIPVIGTTDGNGKTVVEEWLHRLLSPERAITRSPHGYNS